MAVNLFDKEHYELLDQFEREFQLKADAREKDRETWKRGYVYSNGEVNRDFVNYRRGYSFGKKVAEDEAENTIAELRRKLAEVKTNAEARIQELERELAEARSQRWEPVEDGEYVHDSIIDGRIVVRVEDNGKTVRINDTDGYGTECIHLDGTEYRLCRLAPHAQEEGGKRWQKLS